VQLAWSNNAPSPTTTEKALLTLTSDLLVRDEHLRWRTALNETALRMLLGVTDIQLEKSLQESVLVHGFNGTSRLWRMPAAAIRRGSVYRISGAGVTKVAQRSVSGHWLGERVHEGFGRFRLDVVLPGVTSARPVIIESAGAEDAAEETAATRTRAWLEAHGTLAEARDGRTPSLSQWLDLVADLERGETSAIASRINPTTAGARGWKHPDAKAVLAELSKLPSLAEQAAHARLFVRWLRPRLKAELRKGAA
jgi:hypothetical protein